MGVEEPISKFARLFSHEAEYVGAIGGRTLNEGQRLEHRVVNVCSQNRPLLGSNAFPAFVRQISYGGEPPRGEDDGPSDECYTRSNEHGHRSRPEPLDVGEELEADHEECDTGYHSPE